MVSYMSANRRMSTLVMLWYMSRKQMGGLELGAETLDRPMTRTGIVRGGAMGQEEEKVRITLSSKSSAPVHR